MKTLSILILKLAGLALVLLCWRLVSRHAFSFLWSVLLMWGTVALVPVLAIAGRWLLDRHPTPERASLLTIPIHYAEGILLGCALIVAFRFTQVKPNDSRCGAKSDHFSSAENLGYTCYFDGSEFGD